MKKLLIIVMIIFGVTAYSRDFEYREKEGKCIDLTNLEKMGRSDFSKWFPEEESSRNLEFYMELDRAPRGSSGR